MSFKYLKYSLVLAFFFCNAGNLFFRHSALFFLLIHIFYPNQSALFLKNSYSWVFQRKNNYNVFFGLFSNLTFLIIFLWPVYYLQQLIFVDSINADISTSFNQMVGYVLGLWSSGILLFITVKKNLVLYTRHVFWILQICLFSIQFFAPTIYQSTFTEIGFSDFDHFGRFPLSFQEPSSAGVYLFVFLSISLFIFIDKRSPIDLFYLCIGIIFALFFVQSKAFILYFIVFIIIYFNSLFKSKKIIYALPVIISFLYLIFQGQSTSIIFDIIFNINSTQSLTLSDNLSVSTRSVLFLTGLQTISAYPLGTGWGFVNVYLEYFMSHTLNSDNWELMKMLRTGDKISTKTYLLDFIIALGLPGIVLVIILFKRIRRYLRQYLGSHSNFYIIIIPILVAGFMVQGFYLFYLIVISFLISIKKHAI